VIFFDGRVLGLSEAFHPTAIDPETPLYQGRWDFYGSLPPNVSFTAHPKFDANGVGFGTNNAIDWALMLAHRWGPGREASSKRNHSLRRGISQTKKHPEASRNPDRTRSFADRGRENQPLRRRRPLHLCLDRKRAISPESLIE